MNIRNHLLILVAAEGSVLKYYVINATAKQTGINDSTLRRGESMRFFTADSVLLGETEIGM